MTTILRDGHASNVSATTVAAGRTCSKLSSSSRNGPDVLQLIADKLRNGAVGDLLDFERVRQSGRHQVRDCVIEARLTN